MSHKSFKSGFVALIGRPNVGKSTLLNQLVGQKIAISSDKPQTTRNRIQGVYTSDEAQIIFIDTPGIHKPKHKLGAYMTDVAQKTLNEVDMVMFVVDAKEGYGKGDQYIIDRLQKVFTPVFLIPNKIDQISSDALLRLLDLYRTKYDFHEYIPVSAREGRHLHTLTAEIFNDLEEGPKYYPDDQVTDHPERFIAGEMIREKVLQLTRDEIPHSIAVDIESVKQQEDQNLIVMHAVIVVERDSQKGIVIGKQGRMLKEIGKRARSDIEVLFGVRIYLELWVKVRQDWRNREGLLHEFGYRD